MEFHATLNNEKNYKLETHPNIFINNMKKRIIEIYTPLQDLRIGQLVLIKNHQKGPFDPTYIYDHWVAGIPNESIVLLTTPDGREKKCNIHHVNLVSSLDVITHGHNSNVELPTGTFQQSGTAFSRTHVMMSVFMAIPPTTCTTYNQKQRDHKYTFT